MFFRRLLKKGVFMVLFFAFRYNFFLRRVSWLGRHVDDFLCFSFYGFCFHQLKHCLPIPLCIIYFIFVSAGEVFEAYELYMVLSVGLFWISKGFILIISWFFNFCLLCYFIIVNYLQVICVINGK